MTLPLIEIDADLSALNTFGLPARAARLATIERADQVRALMAEPGWAATPRLVLGGGSNLVLTRDFPGLVLRVAIPGRRLVGEDDEAWYVEAGAGESWPAWVGWTLAQGWPGLENLSLIPGTVGAAPVQNIGAYGLELAERLAWLEALDLDTGQTRRFLPAECCFAYRDSCFKQAPGRFLILGVVFRLPKAWQPVTAYGEVAAQLADLGWADPTPQQLAQAVIQIRQRKLPDPAEIGNAGSFFKNPVVSAAQHAALAARHPALPAYPQADGGVKLAAGWLIEQCGWKGRALGPVGVHPRQALVLVNLGGAQGADVVATARAICAEVEARFGVGLEMEPVLI